MKRTFIKGNRINFSLLPELSESKSYVYLKTNYGENLVPAFELLDWQLKSLLRVTLFEAKETTKIPTKKQVDKCLK